MFLEQAQEDFASAETKYAAAKEKYKEDLIAWKRKQEHKSTSATSTSKHSKKPATDEKPKEPTAPRARMHKDEPVNFLRLATALKIIMGSSVKEDIITRALSLLEEYLIEFRKVSIGDTRVNRLLRAFAQIYGEDALKPNHHYSTHIGDQILDFGPVYSFWTFLTERLNKILKNTNTNNWTGGQVEISMMRQFSRDARQEGMVCITPKCSHNLIN